MKHAASAAASVQMTLVTNDVEIIVQISQVRDQCRLKQLPVSIRVSLCGLYMHMRRACGNRISINFRLNFTPKPVFYLHSEVQSRQNRTTNTTHSRCIPRSSTF
jgi:hypothetical protein